MGRIRQNRKGGSFLGRLATSERHPPLRYFDLSSLGHRHHKKKKERSSAFIKTDLDLILRSRGIETLLMTGATTNVCVETTARDVFNRNYDILLVEDCCGAHDEAEHAATLNNIHKYFGKLTTASLFIDRHDKDAHH